MIEKEDVEDELVIIFSNSKNELAVLACSSHTGAVKNHNILKDVNLRKAFKVHLNGNHEIVIMIDDKNKITTYPEHINQEI